MKALGLVACLLLLVGGLARGLVATIFGGMDSQVACAVYTLVGVSAPIIAGMLPKLTGRRPA